MHFFSMGNLFEEFFESREFLFFCSVKLQENFFHPSLADASVVVLYSSLK